MIAFKDFVASSSEGEFLFFKTRYYEGLETAVAEANDWIEEHRPRVLNVETVLLPEANMAGDKGTRETQFTTSGEHHSTWHQFVRVWYEREAVRRKEVDRGDG